MHAPGSNDTVKQAINLLCRWNHHHELIVDGEDRYSGSQLNHESRCVAQALLDRGIVKGDTVALVGTASCRFYAAYLAVQKLGGIACNIHIRESSEFIQQTLVMLSTKAIICTAYLLNSTVQAVALAGRDIAVITLDNVSSPAEHTAYSDILEYFPAIEPHADISPGDAVVIVPQNVSLDDEDPCNIIYNSGATGLPKGIRYFHRRRNRAMYKLALAHRYHSREISVFPIVLYSNIACTSFFAP